MITQRWGDIPRLRCDLGVSRASGGAFAVPGPGRPDILACDHLGVLSAKTRSRVRWAVGAAVLLVGIEAALLAFGLAQVWAVLVGVPLTIAVGVLLAALAPRVQERTRPQPKLSLLVDEDAPVSRLVSNALAPWPVAVARIVANEAADARETVKHERLLQWQFLQALTPRPSDAARQRAKEQFEDRVVAFESELRDWLLEYQQLAAERHACRQVRFRVLNRGAHADAVRLVLELPDSVTVVEEIPSIEAPPSRPVYTGRSMGVTSEASDLLALHLPRSEVRPRRLSAWTTNPAGQTLTDLGDVHRDQVAYAPGDIVLRASQVGDHTIGWKLLTKSASKVTTGSFVFHVPAGDEDRPAFGRMAGVLEYPDVVIRDVPASPWREDGEPVDLQPRTDDPPLEPPEIPEHGPGVDTVDRIIGRRGVMDWMGLGLDPANDGPTSVYVSVGPAEKSTPTSEE